jgi:hypothetical protein
MSRNVGKVDQYERIVVGLALVAFAFQADLSRMALGGIGRLYPPCDCLFQKLPGLQCTGDFDLRAPDAQ